jgi:hypothetical protein
LRREALQLLQAAIVKAEMWQGVIEVHLAVSEVAAHAQRLYERNSFREWGKESRALWWEGRYLHETHMVLELI